MEKKDKKTSKVTGSTIRTAEKIFKGPQRIEIIFLLAKQGIMNIRGIKKVTKCSKSLVLYHLEKLEAIGIVQRRRSALGEVFFRIDKNIQNNFIEIIDSVVDIQNVLKKYGRETRKREKKLKQVFLYNNIALPK
jgi:DNA-binding MarR family transcriptional regulator